MDIRNKHRSFDNDWLPDLIIDSLTKRVLRGLQTDVNKHYSRKYRVEKFVDIDGNKAWLYIILPNGKRKIFKIVVGEIAELNVIS